MPPAPMTRPVHFPEVRLWQSGPPLDGTTEIRTIMAWPYLGGFTYAW